MARPKKYNIDVEQVEKLASFGCTNIEIASVFGCSPDLLEKSYSEYLTKGRQAGKIRLRQAQWKRALGTPYKDKKTGKVKYKNDGSVPMLIFLGKQVLGQSDQPTLVEDEIVEGFDIEVISSVPTSK
tara:strand:+ start:496 stop:876 length:381 start_codon:yes stop_codon:yes gene_type:complete